MKKEGILAAFAAVGAFVAQELGGWDTALIVLLSVMGIDYLTGLLVAGVFHRSNKTEGGGLSSRASFQGLVRKMVVLLLVWLGALLDRVIGSDYVRTAVCLFFIANDALSILENTALMGVPYPAFLTGMLEALRKKQDGGKE